MSTRSQGDPGNGEVINPQKDKPDPSGLPSVPVEGGVVVGGSEFGGLEGATLPGQDPMRVHELIRLLTEDLHPCNLIERYWIQDIAMLTARAEYLRKVHACGLHHASVIARFVWQNQRKRCCTFPGSFGKTRVKIRTRSLAPDKSCRAREAMATD